MLSFAAESLGQLESRIKCRSPTDLFPKRTLQMFLFKSTENYHYVFIDNISLVSPCMRTASSMFNGMTVDSTLGRHSEHRMNNPLPEALCLIYRTPSKSCSEPGEARDWGTMGSFSAEQWFISASPSTLHSGWNGGGEGGQDVGGVCGKNSVHFV